MHGRHQQHLPAKEILAYYQTSRFPLTAVVDANRMTARPELPAPQLTRVPQI